LNTTHHVPGIGQIYTRSGWDTHATWVNLTAGPYTESHAHQDQGSLMIYKDGWLAYDANIDSKSGLMQATNAHGLVRVDSAGTAIKQIASTTSRVHALATGPGWTYAATDLLPAYKNHASIQKMQREMVYLAPDVVVVYDRVQSTAGTTQTWQLATPTQPAISGGTATISNAGHQLKVTRLAPSAGPLSTYSFASTADYTGGWRLDETVAGGDQRYLHVLAIDNAATTIATAGDPMHPGTTLMLSNGKTVTVTFNRDTFGGTLTIDGVTTQLVAGVTPLAE
ncbi:MAG: heparinase II/III family protein, partial [Deltaproteobacteria bacterium]|nr:heparinase II/III family protein [Deltaproteobacteria bacterium]